MIYAFKGFTPVVDPSSFIHPQAAVTGNVVIGKKVYVGPGAAIRGDWGRIIIEDGCNVQENCTLHMFPGATVWQKEGAHIGHGAVIHGATIGRNCLVGMNSVIMDEVDLGDESIVGALTFIKGGERFPPRSLVVGNPGKVIKEVSDEMIRWKTAGTTLYQELPGEMRENWGSCEALQEIPKILPALENGEAASPGKPGEPPPGAGYRPWKESAGGSRLD
ncbi:acyltransferase [Flavitalea flava]